MSCYVQRDPVCTLLKIPAFGMIVVFVPNCIYKLLPH